MCIRDRPRHTIVTNSVDQTRQLGRQIGQLLAGGELIALLGDLGTGKTQLVKGIAVGNDYQNPNQVTSPTFTLVHEYPGRRHLYHLDAYRLNNSQELTNLGLDDMIDPSAVVVIEWADRVADALPPDRLTVQLEATGESSRRLTFQAGGSASQVLWSQIQLIEAPEQV